MTDAQRFLRYVTPGLTFGVVTLLLLTIVIPGWTFHLLGVLFSNESALAAILATLFGSGGVGFLLSVAHHVHFGGIDHSYLIRRLVDAERIVLVDAATGETLPRNTPIDRGLAWIVLTSLWHENLMSCPKLQSVNPRASGLTDLAHSAGTGLVACIVASLITLAITCSVTQFSFEPEPFVRFIAAIAAAIGLIILQYKNYRKVCRVTQGFIEQTFCDTLLNKPLTAVISPSEREGSRRSGESRGLRNAGILGSLSRLWAFVRRWSGRSEKPPPGAGT